MNGKTTRGGKRAGAGRPPKRLQGVEERARRHVDTAITALADIAQTGESESARVSAACALLDRAYGKPRQAMELTGKDGGPVAHREEKEMTQEQVLDELRKRGLPTEFLEE